MIHTGIGLNKGENIFHGYHNSWHGNQFLFSTKPAEKYLWFDFDPQPHDSCWLTVRSSLQQHIKKGKLSKLSNSFLIFIMTRSHLALPQLHWFYSPPVLGQKPKFKTVLMVWHFHQMYPASWDLICTSPLEDKLTGIFFKKSNQTEASENRLQQSNSSPPLGA